MASQTAEHSLPPNEGGKEPVEIAWGGGGALGAEMLGRGVKESSGMMGALCILIRVWIMQVYAKTQE